MREFHAATCVFQKWGVYQRNLENRSDPNSAPNSFPSKSSSASPLIWASKSRKLSKTPTRNHRRGQVSLLRTAMRRMAGWLTANRGPTHEIHRHTNQVLECCDLSPLCLLADLSASEGASSVRSPARRLRSGPRRRQVASRKRRQVAALQRWRDHRNHNLFGNYFCTFSAPCHTFLAGSCWLHHCAATTYDQELHHQP